MIANHPVYITKASSDALKKGNCADGGDIDLPVTETDGSVCSRTIFIENVPSDLVEFLELYLESDKKGGGAIEKLVVKNGGILVTFEDLQGLISCLVDNKVLIIYFSISFQMCYNCVINL